MLKALLLAAAVLALPVVLGFMVIISLTAASETVALDPTDPPPSDTAADDIPPLLLDTYRAAARSCPGLPWTVLAGIGKVETNHSRFGGATLADNGDVTPPILGIVLDGTTPGTAAIPVPAGGSPWHGHPRWDRALGAMQFLTTTFQRWGVDGNQDGTTTPHNAIDAIWSAAAYLCSGDQINDLREAIFRYNRSAAYVDKVLTWANRYSGAPAVVGDYTLPIAGQTIPLDLLIRPHHTYPAWDYGIPVGTPIAAMHGGRVVATTADAGRCGGTVQIRGIDGHIYTYCHLSAVYVTQGSDIPTGTTIGLSGGQPGTPGAGNTTGPHLHLGIRVDSRQICPQPLLVAIATQRLVDPREIPSAGCIIGGPQTDWPTWLEAASTSTLTTGGLPNPHSAAEPTEGRSHGSE